MFLAIREWKFTLSQEPTLRWCNVSFALFLSINLYYQILLWEIRRIRDEKTSSTGMDINLCGGLRYPNQFHGMTREKLRMISPGGISLLRLIQGLVVRMPIPHLVAFPAMEETEDRDKNRKTDRERKTKEWNRGKEKRGEFNMKQHHNVSNIRRSSSSSSLIPKIVKIRSYRRHPQLHTLVYEWRRLGGSLMVKFSIRQTSVHGNGSSFSHHEEPNMPGS